MSAIRVGLCGEYQVGKSLLLNCLLGGDYALVGDLFATTPFPVVYHWSKRPVAKLVSADETTGPCFDSHADFVGHLRQEHCTPEGRARVRQFATAQLGLPLEMLRQISLIDTPGVNASETDPRPEAGTDQEKALQAVESLDLAIFVVPNKAFAELSPQAQLLRRISQRRIPCVVLLNCWDNGAWHPDHERNLALVQNVIAPFAVKLGLRSVSVPQGGKAIADGQVLRINPAWYQAATGSAELVERHQWEAKINNELKGKQPEPAQLRELSRVPDLRRFLFPGRERSVGVNAYCLGTLHRAAEQWSQTAAQRIQQIKKAVTN